MNKLVIGASLLSLTIGAVLSYGQSAPSPSSQPASSPLATEFLLHEAADLLHSPAEAGRAERLIALCAMADRYGKDNRDAIRLMADICQSQGDYDKAAKLMIKALKASPDDYVLGIRWLNSELGQRETAIARVEFLRSIVEGDFPSKPIRAEAAAHLAKIYAGQDNRDEAMKVFQTALSLDPLNYAAIGGRQNVSPEKTSLGMAQAIIEMLKVNPQGISLAWELGILLGDLGLHDQSLEFLDYAWQIGVRELSAVPEEQLVIQYINAMLDAGKIEQAMTMLDSLGSNISASGELQMLFVEALGKAGQTKKADEILAAIETAYKEKSQRDNAPVVSAALAWMYLITGTNPPEALVCATKAAAGDSSNQTLNMLLGAANLAAGNQESGEAILKPMLKTDVYAAAFLAKYYMDRKRRGECQAAIDAGCELSRRGRAWRMISAVARDGGYKISPAKDAQGVSDFIKSADKSFMQMGLNPEKYVGVSVSAKKTFVLGQPIEITSTLQNLSKSEFSVGQWGLVNPAMNLKVAAADSKSYTNIPLVIWPAPRYMAVGKSVTDVTRIDVGDLEKYLNCRPLYDVELTVAGTLDPVQVGDRFVSAMKMVEVAPIKIVRTGLLGQFDKNSAEEWKKAWNNALGRIVADIKSDSQESKLLAARQTASLLAMVDMGRWDAKLIPLQLSETIDRRVLLRMLLELFKDADPVVRAGALISLRDVDLDDSLMSLVARFIKDEDPLVRMAMVNFIGKSNAGGSQELLEKFLSDDDNLVRLVAGSFVKNK